MHDACAAQGCRRSSCLHNKCQGILQQCTRFAAACRSHPAAVAAAAAASAAGAASALNVSAVDNAAGILNTRCCVVNALCHELRQLQEGPAGLVQPRACAGDRNSRSLGACRHRGKLSHVPSKQKGSHALQARILQAAHPNTIHGRSFDPAYEETKHLPCVVVVVLLLLLQAQLLQTGGSSSGRRITDKKFDYVIKKSESAACHTPKAGTRCCNDPVTPTMIHEPWLRRQPQDTLQSHLAAYQRLMAAQGGGCTLQQADRKKCLQRIQ